MDNFSNIKDVLAGVQFQTVNPAISLVIKNWDSIIGKKFTGKAEIVEIYSKMNKNFILVNVPSSSLVQELSFFKKNIIKKIKELYKVEIEDIIIKAATKISKNNDISKQNIIQEIYSEKPTDEELAGIELDNSTIEELKNSVNKQNTLTDKQKERMLAVIIKDLKTQEWMKQKGFPICKKCGRVMIRKNSGEEAICQFCKE